MSKTAREVMENLLLGAGADSRGIDEDIDCAFAEFDRAGFTIVPKEPTEAMKRAWEGPEPWDQHALEVWQDLLAAADSIDKRDEIGMETEPIESAPKDGTRILLWGDCRLIGTDADKFNWVPDWNIAYWDGEKWNNDFDGEILKPTAWSKLPDPVR